MDINLISLNGSIYGLPTSAVREVLDPVPVTPMPFSPDYVDGIVNIGGSVLVQLDLSVQLENGPAISANSGQLMVIENDGEQIALHVDQALLMVSIPGDEIHDVQTQDVPDGMDLNLLSGLFQWQNKSVLFLSEQQLGLKNIAQLKQVDGVGGFVATIETNTSSEADSQKEVTDYQENYLVIEVNNERYALTMDNVCFVEDLETATTLPLAPPEVVGMTYSHQSPILILSLGVLMGKPKSAACKLVVVQHHDFRCALSVDHIHGIHRLACHDNHEALAQDGELAGYLLGAEENLIGVLNFSALFSSSRIDSLKRFLVDDKQQSSKKTRIPTRRLLTFNVGHERCALPLALVEQVVEYQQLEALPEGGGGHLHGAVQIHGDIFPVVDLRIQMDVTTRNTPLTAYVIAGEESNRWALVVDQVNQVVEIPETDIEPASTQQQQYVEEIGRIDNGLLSVMSLSALTAGSDQMVSTGSVG